MPEFSAEFWAATIVAVVLGTITLLLGLGATLAMDAKTKGEFRFAVGCFIFSGLMITSTIGLWGVTTQALMLKRILVSGCLFFVVGVLLVEAIRWTHFRHLNVSIPEPAKHESGPPSLPSTAPEQPSKPPSEPLVQQHKPELKPVVPIEPQPQPSVTFTAYSQPDEPYFDGTLLAGIVWQKQFVDVRLDIANGAVPIQNLDFLVGLDTSIAGVGQISQFPGITAFPADTPPAAWLQGTDLQGNPISVPIAPMPGMMRAAPVYRVNCSGIFANTVVHLVIASIALNPAENGQLPKQLFAPRRSPGFIRAKGSYETKSGNSVEKHPVEFSYRFAQTPSPN